MNSGAEVYDIFVLLLRRIDLRWIREYQERLKPSIRLYGKFTGLANLKGCSIAIDFRLYTRSQWTNHQFLKRFFQGCYFDRDFPRKIKIRE